MTPALLEAHRPDSLVAFGARGEKTAADLLADAARVAQALPPPTDGSQVLLVFEGDRYAMAAALLGAFEAGHSVALPPSTRRESVLSLMERPETAAVVHDMGAGISLRVDEVLDAALEREPAPRAALPPRENIATLFTSGSTGETRAWPKSASQLLGEASLQGEVFGVGPGSRVVGTVSPGHIYGLIFTVLLPLCRGAAFLRETPLHGEPIARVVREHGADVLVTVPVHLRTLAALEPGALGSLRRVFSSAGALPREDGESFAARHGLEAIEILGSTETGGVAYRRGADRFRPFPGIEVSVDGEGALLVDSPFVDASLPRPYRTADLAVLYEDGTFDHRGRSDGVVKVGGRRVSISEMEQRLARHPGVRDAAVVALPAPAGRGHQLLAAVVAPSCTAQEIKAALLERFEASSLPRRILQVDALPRESNGKLTRARLLRLFGLRPDARPINWSLGWGSALHAQEGAIARREFAVDVPVDYGWFEGHFPGYPILAGAVQLKELVLPAVESAFPGLGAVKQMSRIKFTGRILPGDRVTVQVEREGDDAVVDFVVRKPSEVCSAGRLVFGAARANGAAASGGAS